MNRSATQTPARSDHPPTPIIKSMRWPFPLIWLVPVCAAALAGYYYFEHVRNNGPQITITFSDATGLKAGQTQVSHLGVTIGQVTGITLSPDMNHTQVTVQLLRAQSAFARSGAVFWIVRPQISTQEISGLGTIMSGPLIDATPGTGMGEIQARFTGLDKPPLPTREGLHIVLKAPNTQRLQPDSPVYYRGIQVGFIQDLQLSSDATTADFDAIILRRYAPLVHGNSRFWAVSAVDLKGGIFTGIQVKVESLRSMLSGGVAFATPDEDMGEEARDGAAFNLYDDSKKEWLAWAPKISIGTGDSEGGEDNPKLPPPPKESGGTVGCTKLNWGSWA